MLSLANSDTNSCVLYLENYLDCIDNLPDDLQRHLTKMRELDVSYQDLLHDIETLASQYVESISRGKSDEKVRLLTKIQSTLILAQELGDAKLQIVQQLQDLIENKTRSLDNDYRNIDNGSKEKDLVVSSGSISSCVSNNAINANNSINDVSFKEQITISAPASSSSNGSIEQRTSKRVRRVRGETDSNNEHNSTSQHHHHHHYSEHGGSIPMPRVNATLIISNQKKHNNNVSTTKKKKRQKKQGQRNSMQKEDNRGGRTAASNNDDDDDDLSVDPDEPTYCLCDQVSYGEMICCDNDLCPIEWFHFSCVSLNHKPKGKWFCPKCRGDRPNVKKPKAQLEKELERYNREKEETARSH